MNFPRTHRFMIGMATTLLLASASCEPGGADLVRDASLPYRIEVEPVATLGAPDDSILLDWEADLAANDAVIAAGGLPVRGALALYDWQGRQVRAIATYGGGPSELRRPRPTLGPGDSLWILDTGNQRVSVLEPDGSGVARAFPLRGEIQSLHAADSGLVVVAGTMLPDGVDREDVDEGSWPYIHVIDRTGALDRSFLPRRHRMLGTRIAAVSGSRIWLATMHRPVLEEWSLTGRRLRRIERELDWFEPWDTTDDGIIEALRLRPRVAGLGVDVKGRLWVKTYLPVVDRETVRSRADYNRVMDTLIEVVDPATGETLARRRFDAAYISRVAGRDLWATARQDSAGYVYVDVWRGRLEPQ